MQSLIKRQWRAWLLRKRRRMADRHLLMRAVVLQKGIPLSVYVIDVYPTRVSIAQQRLVRLQLHVRLLNDNCLRAISFAFVNRKCIDLKGTSIRIRFLPGDWSHVVVML